MESKLRQLKRSFSDADETVLLEVLLSCNGSLSTAELLLSEQLQIKKQNSSRQTNIRQLFGDDGTKSLLPRGPTSKPVLLYTKVDVERTLKYATIHYNFLSQDTADSMLKYILQDKGFSPQEFHLFGNKCVSNHSNKVYSENIEQGFFYNGTETKFNSEYTNDMKITQCLIEDQVNKEINERPRKPFQMDTRWEGKLAICNKYDGKSNNLDWHSDRMTYLGPHCVIASLTLGATREFRVRKQYKTVNGKLPPVYSIPLPHNTLLIMHAGFQEEFKHCVSSTTEISTHHISGSTRINMTYRHYLARFKKNLPMCEKCGFQMDLRRSYKDPETRGRYIWLCTGGYQNKECNGFHWADFAKECLYTDDVNECSVWIDRSDKEALNCFREMIKERIESLTKDN